jgi:fimbrial chaperone protein
VPFFYCRLAAAALAWIGLSLCVDARAQAQALQISPISVALQPGQMTTTLSVENTGADSAALQIRPFRWSQTNQQDLLTDTDDLLVSPPITTIGGGQTQIFRVVLRRPAGRTEASYRLLLDQLPPPSMPGVIRIALRLSIPVFAEPEAAAGSDVVWRVIEESGSAVLVGFNRGGKHLHIVDASLSAADGRRFKLQALQLPYVLPGAEHRWRVENATGLRPGSTVSLAATSDAGPVHASLQVSEP